MKKSSLVFFGLGLFFIVFLSIFTLTLVAGKTDRDGGIWAALDELRAELNNIKSQLSFSCPEGMVDFGGYCMDKKLSETSLTYADALGYCNQKNLRVCNKYDWAYACLSNNADIELLTTTKQWVEEGVMSELITSMGCVETMTGSLLPIDAAGDDMFQVRCCKYK